MEALDTCNTKISLCYVAFPSSDEVIDHEPFTSANLRMARRWWLTSGVAFEILREALVAIAASM
jgi:hypothetical protein